MRYVMRIFDTSLLELEVSYGEGLRRALNVTLENDTTYPMESGRIEALNCYLHAAARRLLDIPVVDENGLAEQLDAIQPSVSNAPVLCNEALLDGLEGTHDKPAVHPRDSIANALRG